MKKFCIIFTLALLCSAPSYAQLKVIGTGDNMSVDTSVFPPKMQAAYDLMTKKCGKCHTMERVIVSVQTGLCPFSKTSFTKDTAKSIVTRMLLKPESDMTRKDAKTILELLNFMLDEKLRVAEKH